MHISQLRTHRYLAKEDVGEAGLLATIRQVGMEQVDEERNESKPVMHFLEPIKPLIVNQTNLEALAVILQSEETDHWLGRQIVLYSDPNVSFRGQRVGGIRVRAAQAPQAPQQPPQPAAPPPQAHPPQAPQRPPQSFEQAAHDVREDDIPW